jgi:hypothetical protein
MSQLSVCPEETKRTKWSPHCLVLQIPDQLSVDVTMKERVSTTTTRFGQRSRAEAGCQAN